MTREEAKRVLEIHLEHWQRLTKEKICTEQEGAETISAFNMAINALEQLSSYERTIIILTNAISEQETVSRESYEHEYLLRKEFEMKIAKLEQQEPILDKIRAEIIEKYWDCDICKFNGHFNIRGDINDILLIIDKYTKEGDA